MIAPLITAPYISRVLGAEGVGIYSYTVTIVCAFALFASLGIGTYGQREIARCGDQIAQRSTIFWELVTLRVIMTLVTSGLYLFLAVQYKAYTIYLLMQYFCLFVVFLDLSWFFQGIEDFKIVTLKNCFVKILTISLIFLLVNEKNHVNRYILINSLSGVISSLMCFPSLRGKIIWVPWRNWNVKRHLRGAIQFLIPMIATQLYSQLDKMMLGAQVTDIAESGYYEQARKITTILVAVLTSINTVMFPRISNLYAKRDYLQIKKLHSETFRLILMLLVPIIMGLWCVLDNFVLWFFGPGFEKVSLLLRFSGILIIFMSIGNFVGLQYLSPMGMQNQMSKIYLTSAGINFILNFFLIRWFYSAGAMIASVAAEAFSCGVQIFLLKKSDFNFRMLSGVHKYIISAFVMSVSIMQVNYIFQLSGVSATVVDILIGALVYLLMLIIMRDSLVLSILKTKKQNQ